MNMQCSYCNGTGMEHPDCESCNGVGWVDDPSDGGTMVCPECDGEPCPECDGTGEGRQPYLEIVDARTGDAKHTGIGAIFETGDATRQAFESARPLHTEGGGFFLDLHTGDGDLVDTIELTAEGVEQVSGTKPESPEYYVEYDKKQWGETIAEIKKAKGL